MSIIYCSCCGYTYDSDFDEYETIMGDDVCVSCLSKHYELCDSCDEYYNTQDYDACPAMDCRIKANGEEI